MISNNTQTDVNEAIKVDKYRKLRDAVHDIVVELGEDDWLSSVDLSKKLKDYKINIPPPVLKRLLKDFNDEKFNLFISTDISWLYYDEKTDSIFSTLHFEQDPVLGKGRKKAEEDSRKTYTTWKSKKKVTLCPVPSDIIKDTFVIEDETDVGVIKRFIHRAIERDLIDFVYEESWEYMIKNVPKPISEGGLGIELKDPNKHKPLEGWIIPEEKDLDTHMPVLHYKHGTGHITSIDGEYIKIDFIDKDKPTETVEKRLKKPIVLKNKSIRIPKNYIKRPSDKKGYLIGYLKDMTYGKEIYHKTRKEGGKIDGTASVNDYISIKLDNNKKIKIGIEEFLIDQNVLTKIEDKKPITRTIPHRPSDSDDYIKLNTMSGVKAGDILYMGAGKKEVTVKDIDSNFITLKSSSIGISRYNYYYTLNTLLLYRKKAEQNDKNDGSYIRIKNAKQLKVGDIVYYGENKKKRKIKTIEGSFITFNEDDTKLTINFAIHSTGLYKKNALSAYECGKLKGFIPATNVNQIDVGTRVWVDVGSFKGATNVVSKEGSFFTYDLPGDKISHKSLLQYFIDSESIYIKRKDKSVEDSNNPHRYSIRLKPPYNMKAGQKVWILDYGIVEITDTKNGLTFKDNKGSEVYLPPQLIGSTDFYSDKHEKSNIDDTENLDIPEGFVKATWKDLKVKQQAWYENDFYTVLGVNTTHNGGWVILDNKTGRKQIGDGNFNKLYIKKDDEVKTGDLKKSDFSKVITEESELKTDMLIYHKSFGICKIKSIEKDRNIILITTTDKHSNNLSLHIAAVLKNGYVFRQPDETKEETTVSDIESKPVGGEDDLYTSELADDEEVKAEKKKELEPYTDKSDLKKNDLVVLSEDSGKPGTYKVTDFHEGASISAEPLINTVKKMTNNGWRTGYLASLKSFVNSLGNTNTFSKYVKMIRHTESEKELKKLVKDLNRLSFDASKSLSNVSVSNEKTQKLTNLATYAKGIKWTPNSNVEKDPFVELTNIKNDERVILNSNELISNKHIFKNPKRKTEKWVKIKDPGDLEKGSIVKLDGIDGKEFRVVTIKNRHGSSHRGHPNQIMYYNLQRDTSINTKQDLTIDYETLQKSYKIKKTDTEETDENNEFKWVRLKTGSSLKEGDTIKTNLSTISTSTGTEEVATNMVNIFKIKGIRKGTRQTWVDLINNYKKNYSLTLTNLLGTKSYVQRPITKTITESGYNWRRITKLNDIKKNDTIKTDLFGKVQVYTIEHRGYNIKSKQDTPARVVIKTAKGIGYETNIDLIIGAKSYVRVEMGDFDKHVKSIENAYDENTMDEYIGTAGLDTKNFDNLVKILNDSSLTYNQYVRLMNIFMDTLSGLSTYDGTKKSDGEERLTVDVTSYINMIERKFPQWAKKFNDDQKGI